MRVRGGGVKERGALRVAIAHGEHREGNKTRLFFIE
ncbi:hypothetical protein NORO109296_14920 [Nocardiopsis rhodophaea]